jgi:CRP-like cAMP-binding protein
MDPIPIHPRIQRRRDLAASLHIPPELGAKFTESERAVLKIISSEVARHGACTLTRDAIADLSNISRRVVMTALRTAKAEGLIEVRQSRYYNIITVSATWKAWLDRYGDAPPDATRGG